MQVVWFAAPLTIKSKHLHPQDILKCFDLMFSQLDQNHKLPSELICDIIEIVVIVWYERNQVIFQGKQVNSH